MWNRIEQTGEKTALRDGRCRDYQPGDNMYLCEERRTKAFNIWNLIVCV